MLNHDKDIFDLLDHVAAGGWEIDLATRFFTPGPRLRDLLGYVESQRQQQAGFPIKALIHPEEFDTLEYALSEASMGSQRSFNLDLRLKCASGEWLWVSLAGSPCPPEPTQAIGHVTGIAVDISRVMRAEAEIASATEVLEQGVRERTESLRQANRDLVRQIRQRQSAEAQIREHTHHLQEFIDRIPVALMVFDPQKRIHRVNQQFVSLVKTSRERLIGKHPNDLFNLKLAEELLKHNEALTDESPEYHYEADLVFPTTGTRRTAITKTLLPIPTFDKPGIICAIQDVTARRAMEDALRRSERRYRGIIESQTDLIVRINPEGRFTFVNDAFCKFFSTKSQGLLGASIRPFIHPDDVMRTMEQINAVLRPPYRNRVIHRTLTARGTRWIAWENVAIRNEFGRVVEIQGVARDISDLKTTQQALETSESRFRFVTEAVPDLVMLVDARGEVQQVFADSPNLLPDAVDSHEGTLLTDLFPEESASSLLTLLEQSLLTNEMQEVDFGIAYESNARWVSARSVRLDRPGEPMVLLLCRDITEQHEIEEARNQLDSQVREMQRLESIGTLASGVAHNFDNLLMVMTSALEMAQNPKASSDDAQHALALMNKAVIQAKDLTRSLSTFARRSAPAMENIDLREVLEEARPLVERLLPKPIKVDTKFADGPMPMVGNRTELQQVLMNLVTNARDAMPQGGQLTICLTRHDDGNASSARLDVSDTGTGIPEDKLGNIFEPFYTTKPRGQGTGLGLAVAHGIIRRHDGQITAHSIMGQGTTFKVELPLTE